MLVVLLGAGPGSLAAQPTVPPASPASIGTATMQPDGTVLLQLRATGPGAIGDAMLRYRPGEPGYATVRNHLPALRPGLTLPVPPFP